MGTDHCPDTLPPSTRWHHCTVTPLLPPSLISWQVEELPSKAGDALKKKVLELNERLMRLLLTLDGVTGGPQWVAPLRKDLVSGKTRGGRLCLCYAKQKWPSSVTHVSSHEDVCLSCSGQDQQQLVARTPCIPASLYHGSWGVPHHWPYLPHCGFLSLAPALLLSGALCR